MKFSRAKQLCKTMNTIIIESAPSGQYLSDGINSWRMPDGQKYTARGIGTIMDFDLEAMANNEIYVEERDVDSPLYNAERTDLDRPLVYRMSIRYQNQDLEIWQVHGEERLYILHTQAIGVLADVKNLQFCARGQMAAAFEGMILVGLLPQVGREHSREILATLAELGEMTP